MTLGETSDSGDEGFLVSLSPEQAGALQSLGIARTYERGTALFHERQAPDRLFILLNGRVKLTALSEGGKEVVLEIRGPGDLLGELSALDDELRSATAVALEPVEALVIPARDFAAFLERHPGAGTSIIRILTRRLRDADRRRIEFCAQDSMGRIAARIVELTERFGKPVEAGVQIDLPISQEELAGWTGCSRVAVSTALHSMRELGWIETERRRITVVDLPALRRRSV